EEFYWDYAGAYRLISDTHDGSGPPYTHTSVYDPAGNRLSDTLDQSAAGGTTFTTTYEYDTPDAVIHSHRNEPGQPYVQVDYNYDPNGNRTEKDVHISGVSNHSTTYAYDTSNRLISASSDTVGAIFHAAYDARTRRLYKDDGSPWEYTLFRYDGGTNFQELRERGNYWPEVITDLVRAGGLGGGIGSILYSDGTMAEGEWNSFLYDAVGNTIELLNPNATVRQENLYDAFGKVLS